MTRDDKAWRSYPEHWPPHYNSREPCDMAIGACLCGAWHSLEEDWVKQLVKNFGWVSPELGDNK